MATGQSVTDLKRLRLRKSVAQVRAEYESGTLKRGLGALNLISLGIGCFIGTGFFVLTGSAAANYAGPAIMVSFVLTAQATHRFSREQTP